MIFRLTKCISTNSLTSSCIPMIQISKTDLRTAIKYLEDSTIIYDALAILPMQKCKCRSHMIKQLVSKFKKKLPNDKK